MAEPLTLITDSREQRELDFSRFKGVATIRKGLKTGDYSISGLEDKWICERKSVQDIVGTLVSGHERFLREMERMRDFEERYILIEHSPSVLFSYCMQHGWQNKFNLVIQSLLAYAYQYHVRIRFCKDREDMAKYIVRKSREFIAKKGGQDGEKKETDTD